MRTSARMLLTIIENTPHAFATRFEKGMSRASALHPRQKAYEKLIPCEDPKRHGFQGERSNRLPEEGLLRHRSRWW